MNVRQLKIDVPEDIFIALNESEGELKNEMKTYTAVWLYLKNKLTLGKAASFAGISRIEFEALLSQNEVPISLLTYDDIKKDTSFLSDFLDD